MQSLRWEIGQTVTLIKRRSVEEFGEVKVSLTDILTSQQRFGATIKGELNLARSRR